MYSQKPHKRRISELISDVCAQSHAIEEKGDRQGDGSFLRFKAKLRRKLLRNQLTYKQNISIIKKIKINSPGKYTNGGIFN